MPTRTSAATGSWTKRPPHDDAKAVRDHARPGLVAGQQDRLVAHRAADLCRPPAALQRAVPGGRRHPGLALPRRERQLRSRVAPPARATTPSRRSWGASATTAAKACATAAKIDTAVGINSVERFLGDEALKRGWRFDAPREESGRHVLIVGAGPSGMSAAYHLRRLGHAVTVIEAGPLLGGMMRFGIPKYRLPRDVLDAEMQRIVDMGVDGEARHQGRGPGANHGGRGLRRDLPRRRRAHRQARVHPGEGFRPDPRRRRRAALDGRRGAADARPPGGRLRRRQHRHRRRPHGQAPRRHRGRHRLPAHARAHAGARLRGRGGARGRRPGQVALDHQAGRRRRP